ncbi:MAG TPA: hypothetical protein VHA33_04195 [Candidatus Angelobacter sp.]|jgi:hypothetical protein|nr:hypothetical protein [Candidatus Angelobacter sp.]
MTVPDPKVHSVILKAIDEIKLLRFVFGGKERIVEPHDYGVHQGLIRLFAYQVAGESTTGHLPAWRLMEAAKMSEVEMLDQTFPGSRAESSQQHRQWEKIFARVKKKEKKR